jgi:hypothetical protein
MAESFPCKSGWVHFSNEAVELLYAAWIEHAAKGRATPGMATVEQFLQQLLDGEGPGCRSFGLCGEYLPDELSGPEALDALAVLIRYVLDDPRRITGVAWDDELIVSWRERLVSMLASVEEEARGL